MELRGTHTLAIETPDACRVENPVTLASRENFMKKIAAFALVAPFALSLAACGSADDASTEAEADTVEIQANDAMAEVTEEPVADEGAAVEDATAAAEEAATDTAEAAGDAAADIAAQVEAASAEDGE